MLITNEDNMELMSRYKDNHCSYKKNRPTQGTTKIVLKKK